MPKHEEITCPRCNHSFECKCGTIQLCLCMSVQLDDAQREFIAEQYDGCLCRDCLDELAQKNAALVFGSISS
jgi:hypothetical protein